MSDPMEQENTRATATDLEWLEQEIRNEERLAGWDGIKTEVARALVAASAARHRRILSSLRSPSVAPALEQLPRAWEWSAEGKGGTVHRVLTKDAETAATWRSDDTFGGTVTPLYAALSTGDGPELNPYVVELEEIVCDALHTLENEKTAGTVFDEPGWVDGTLAALRSIKGTMDREAPHG